MGIKKKEYILKKEDALLYLKKNMILNIGMIDPITRDSAEILYANKDGVLIREVKSKVYMLSVENLKKGIELINNIDECRIITIYQDYMIDYIFKKFGINKEIECYQGIYKDKSKLNLRGNLEIKVLKEENKEIILKNYDKLSEKDIDKLLKNKSLFGGYKNGTLIGFVGNHLEGSIGILEVFEKYRGLGYGTELESYMVNKMIEKGLIPFVQVEINNEKSIKLQKKLGFEISKEKLYWMF